MSEYMIPISMFAMVFGVVWVIAGSKSKSKKEVQRTIQAAINNNTELTPEVIKALGTSPAKPYADLRNGIVLIAVALGFIVLGTSISNTEHNEEAMSVMLGVAAFPGFIGLALVAMHFFLKSKKDNIE